MTAEELLEIQKSVGKQAADAIKLEISNVNDQAKKIAEEVVKNSGGITKATFDEYQEAQKQMLGKLEDIAAKQGTTLADLATKLGGEAKVKSIRQTLSDAKDEIMQRKSAGHGTIDFMLTQKADGSFGMERFDPSKVAANKAAGVTGTIDGLSGGGSTASVSQSVDAAAILRAFNGNANITSQYRNTQWLFDLVNVKSATFTDFPMAIWFEEVPKQGGAAIVLEGGTKPPVQYAYTIKSAEYKKAAQLATLTDEFHLDFAMLESDMMTKGKTDVLNFINSSLLADIQTNATAYSTAVAFEGGVPVTNVNDFDAIAALAAQADAASYGTALSNVAIMSTFKKYRMGITKSTYGEYINRPDVLSNLAFVGNNDIAADALIVGDLKKVNLILRGGYIVKIGYNGTNFAENKFSVVMEQYFYDYIPAISKTAIISGPSFAAVKSAITATS